VLVCAYELFCAGGDFQPAAERSAEVNIALRERLFDAWEEVMLRTGFTQPQKLEHMMMGLRRILSRGQMTEADAKILMGLAKQTLWITERWENAGAPRD
jgi:tRNA C32,U32 (ribose-2'-O)-methylase TrmJ